MRLHKEETLIGAITKMRRNTDFYERNKNTMIQTTNYRRTACLGHPSTTFGSPSPEEGPSAQGPAWLSEGLGETQPEGSLV